MKTLRFPPAFDHLDYNQLIALPTRVVDISHGYLTEATYNNLDEAALKCNGFNGYMGPFADRIDGKLCIRFESTEACRKLSE